jgi:hypothetical protein
MCWGGRGNVEEAEEFDRLNNDQLMSIFLEEGSARASSENGDSDSDGGIKQHASGRLRRGV